MLDPTLAEIYNTERTLRRLLQIERQSSGKVKIARALETAISMAGVSPIMGDTLTGFGGQVMRKLLGRGSATNVALGLVGNVMKKPLSEGYRPMSSIVSKINPKAYKNALNMLRSQMGQPLFQ